RFGLGLKTASFSQCRRVSVFTKEKHANTIVRQWDLDHVARTNEWRLVANPKAETIVKARTLEESESGTIVIWEALDRIVGTEVTSTDRWAQDRFFAVAQAVERHLAMVFHRYLEGRNPRLRIFMSASGTKGRVQPWDPFFSDHHFTFKTPEETVLLPQGEIRLQGFVLPHKDRLKEEEFELGAGTNGWTAHQGFYIYRNDRLLVSGGWLGLGEGRRWRKEEHFRLARLRLDFPNSMDEFWSIDLKKSTARPPDLLQPRLRQLADEVRTRAKNVFVHRGKYGARAANRPPERAWNPVTRNGHTTYQINRSHPLIADVLQRNTGDPAVERMLRVIEETVPVHQIWLDTSESPDGHNVPFGTSPGDDLTTLAKDFVALLTIDGRLTVKQAAEVALNTEPFCHHPAIMASLFD
ncbi:MAG: ATP-binding protein, partial [Verrucomicrobiaceae bacterium]